MFGGGVEHLTDLLPPADDLLLPPSAEVRSLAVSAVSESGADLLGVFWVGFMAFQLLLASFMTDSGRPVP